MTNARKQTEECNIVGCSNPVGKRQLCNMHYLRWYRHGNANYIQPPIVKKICIVEECAEKTVGRGYCDMHYRRFRRNGDANTTRFIHHGMSGSREVRSWVGMHQRCNNPNNPRYAGYGGRGIKVCEGWNRFENFYADMGPSPSPKHSIDRINNDSFRYGWPIERALSEAIRRWP